MWIDDSLVARLVFGFELERSCANLRDAGGRHNAARCETCCELRYYPTSNELMKFKLAPTIATGLLFLASLAQADNFFVANTGVNSITKYDDNGGVAPFTSEFVNGPNGLALDSSGNLYVTTNSNVIRKFSPSGVDLGVFASTGINFAMGLAFDSKGNLYVANNGGSTIQKFAPDGTDLGIFANVIRPTGLAFDAAGTFTWRISATRSALFDRRRSFRSALLNNPEGLAFDSSGGYVANNGSTRSGFPGRH